MGTKFKLLLLIISSSLVLALSSKAQDTLAVDKSLYYRAILGGGTGSGSFFTGKNSMIGFNFELMIERNKTVYSIAGRSLSTFKISNMNNYMQSYDLTIGRVLKSNNLFSSLSLGIAYLEGETWHKIADQYHSKNYQTIGLPISIKGFIVPFRYYGLGVDLYANINSASSFYGIYLCHQVGLLKRMKKH